MEAIPEGWVATEVHIKDITHGDTIWHDGMLRTVCGTDIRRGTFMGDTIFGDSYRSGYKPVTRVDFKRVLTKR